MNNVTVLFPGGFKPITGAHMALAQRYTQNPNVDRVIMLIGPKERDGITRNTSIKLFNLLNRNNNIEIQPTDFNSPIMAAYEYLFNLPEDTQGQFALAASEKDNDYVRVKSFIPNIDKYKTVGDQKGRLIAPGVDAIELTVSGDPLKYIDGNPISASTVRAALKANLYSKFAESYPNYDESIIQNIWQMLGGVSVDGAVLGSNSEETVGDPTTSVSKRRAGAELKQKLSGKRSDGLGDYNAVIYGLDNSGRRVELKSLSDLNKYTQFELDSDTSASSQEVSLEDFKEFEEQYNSAGEILRKFYEAGIKHPNLKKAHEALHMYLNDGQPDFNIEVGAQGELEPSLKKILVRNASNESLNLKEWLLQELKEDATELFTELRTGKRLRVFDFDDTLSKMNATIYVTHKDGTNTELSPSEFAVYEPRPGDDFDFKDFDKIIKGATPISINIDALRQAHNDPGAKTTILTARSIAYPVKRYLEKEHGLKNIYVVAIGSSNPMDKAKWIEDQIKKGYDDIYFIDDSAKNIAAVKTLVDKYPDVKMDIELAEGYETPKGAKAHIKKINKLRKYLDNSGDRGFVYDFDKFPKTVFGTKYLKEGGLAGHMNHPYDRHELTFADMKEMIARALEGRLDIENAVTEKTDGQNIFMTVKDGQVKFARGTKERVNPLTVQELQSKFAGRGAISAAFGEAGTDLAAAFAKVGAEKLNSIFQNGKIFANMEIIYPDTKNVIAYEKAVLQFHNLVEYDEKGNVVQTDMSGGNVVQKAIEDANAHMQTTFNLIPPQKIKLGPVENFQDYQDALFKELDQLRNRYNLKDTDKVTEYHIAWWREVIKAKANKDNYNIPEDVLELLVNRWAFYNKSTSITKIKKMIDNEAFLEWVLGFDTSDFKKYQKQNLEPFESIFLKLGAEVLKNATNFLAANPSKAVQDIRKELANVLRAVKSSNNLETLDKLKVELNRIKKLGGFKKIVPVEGIVFTYGGETYKLTGAFAPVNQILGTLKYSR